MLANRPNGLIHYYGLAEWRATIAHMPDTPISDEKPGFHMVYSSGTTGRPKGIRLPLPEGDVTDAHMLAQRSAANYGTNPATVYLSPAPLYHTAPLAFTTSCHRLGATVIVMPKFDPEEALKAIARYKVSITQMVPTMFVRLLKLPDAVRLKYDVSSLQHVIHAAAPCPHSGQACDDRLARPDHPRVLWRVRRQWFHQHHSRGMAEKAGIRRQGELGYDPYL